MTGQESDGSDHDGVDAPSRPGDPEQVVDALEDRVVGHRVDQARTEDDDPDKPAFEQDLDTEDPAAGSDTGAGAEPSS
ncbi:MAG TPA: hypothetical protein VL595_18900 [Pseudonocardia sp.]|nr:hypothetical protein [Pseudonocardia sp.]